LANTIQQNLVPSEPQLIDLLNLLKKDVMLNLNCHHIGKITLFNLLTQTASATINYQKTFFQFNQITGTYDSVTADYPMLMECPVVCLGGGTAALTFPISAGDECLVLFNDRDIDNWYAGSSNSPNATARLHNFSDGIILVGIRSLANSLVSYDMTRAVLRNGVGGTTLVGVGDTLIKIANVTTSLNTLLQSMVSDIQSIVSALQTVPLIAVTGSPGGPSPINPVITGDLVSIASSLTTLGTEISGLLE
jgi:hypothetical protein